jgi:hypothetical protein
MPSVKGGEREGERGREGELESPDSVRSFQTDLGKLLLGTVLRSTCGFERQTRKNRPASSTASWLSSLALWLWLLDLSTVRSTCM